MDRLMLLGEVAVAVACTPLANRCSTAERS